MEELAYFDPLKFKFPIGVVKKEQQVEFCVDVNLNCTPNEMYLMIKFDGNEDYEYVSLKRENLKFVGSYEFKKSGLYFYNFKLNYNDFSKYLSKTNDNFSCVLDAKGEDFVQVVTEKQYECLDSMQGGIIYQIFVDRFAKSGEVEVREPFKKRDDWGGLIKKNTCIPVEINEEVFCGNLQGVISKLEYLSKLSVTVIYLNPICLASSNHKYDTADFMTVDPMFGGDQAFKELIEKANKLGIKIVIDGVFNHTGSDSIYFNKCGRFGSEGAYGSKNSKYFNWYSFREFPNLYDCWWDIVTLPSIKKDCIDFQNFIAGNGGVIEKFMNMGVFGIRLDVVDELSDDFTKMISNKVLSYGKNKVVMGEVWEDASTKISYSKRRRYFSQNELNSVMNYPLKESILNYAKSKEPKDLVSTMRMLKNNYPKVVMDNLMNSLGTHDTGRIFSQLEFISNGNEFIATQLYKVCFGILFTLPGVPSIFYGDEYGEKNNDESSRGCFDWENYDNEIFKFTKKLAKIRKMKVLKDGEFNIIFAENGKFVFERKNKNERIIVLSNLRPSELDVHLEGKFISFFSNSVINDFKLYENKIEILIEKKD